MRLLVYTIFFLSGIAGLTYEIVWVRQFVLVFGNTTQSITTVLSAFMAGLALGSIVAGRAVDRRPEKAFLLYGLLEIGIGLWGIAILLLFPLARMFYPLVVTGLSPGLTIMTTVKFLTVFLIILPSTTMMGATLPVLVRFLVRPGERFSVPTGRLYAVNTLGATLGCLLAGFILIELAGLRDSQLLIVALNLSLGVAVLFLNRMLTGSLPEKAERVKTATLEKRPFFKAEAFKEPIIYLFALSGLAALAYEIIWTRILVLALVVDAYAFSLMLSIFLGGIAIGSYLGSALLKRYKGGYLLFGIVQALIGTSAIISFMLMDRIPALQRAISLGDSLYWQKSMLIMFAKSNLLMLLPVLVNGMAFPLAVQIFVRKIKTLGSRVGELYFANTLGAIGGSLLAGFLLIPLVGIQKALLIIASLSVLIGIVAILKGGPRFPILRYATSGGFIVVLVVLISLLGEVSAYGFRQIPTYRNARLLWYKECFDHTIMVTEDLGHDKTRRLLINRNQATSTDLIGQRKNQILGHLPIWFNPEARKALVICFGSGGTAGTIGAYSDISSIDCVEICPTVIECNHFFRDFNRDIVADPRIRIIIDDGRNHLQTTKEKYDIITLEPMHPGLSGVVSLYTVEFYRGCQRRLNRSGVVCQWVPLYSMSVKDAKSIIRSFCLAFPHSSFWIVGQEGVLLGSSEPQKMDFAKLKQLFDIPAVKSHLARVLIDNPVTVLSYFVMGEEALLAYTSGAPVVTDDFPVIEYSIPRSKNRFLYEEIAKLQQDQETIATYLTGVSAKEKEELEMRIKNAGLGRTSMLRGFEAYRKGDYRQAFEHFSRCLELDYDQAYIKYFMKRICYRFADAYAARGKFEEARAFCLQAMVLDPDDPETHLALGVANRSCGDLEEALKQFSLALKMKPDYRKARDWLVRTTSELVQPKPPSERQKSQR